MLALFVADWLSMHWDISHSFDTIANNFDMLFVDIQERAVQILVKVGTSSNVELLV